MNKLRPTISVLALLLSTTVACGKSKPADAPTPAPVTDAVAEPPKKEDPAVAAKLAAAYPKLRCLLGSGVRGADTIYQEAGFASPAAYSAAFQVQAAANPAWARALVGSTLAKPCVDLPKTPTPAAPDPAPASPSPSEP